MDNINPVTIAHDIILQAAQGIPLQGDVRMADELLWYQARELYDLHAKGMITADIGAERKNKILGSYTGNRAREQQYTTSNQQVAALFRGIETAARDYAKTKTLDNADKLYYALYHVLPKGCGA